MKTKKLNPWMVSFALTFFLIILTGISSHAALRTKIVVLPFYVEDGLDADTGIEQINLEYRRMSGFIENQLVSNGFIVVDPFANDNNHREFSRVMEQAREDSLRACRDLAQRFSVDAIYLVWLDVKVKKTADGYYKTSAILDGKGYDSGGRSLGANVMKTFTESSRDRDKAIALVEKEVGDVVGRTLTNWNSKSSGSQGRLSKAIQQQQNYINLRLDGANEYEIVEVFGKVIHTVGGIVHAKRYSQIIVPDNPKACVTQWETEIDSRTTDPFRLQANIMKVINDILDAGGTIYINNVPYRYTPSEMKLLMGVRPGSANPTSIQFVVDRERMRDREFSGRHNPENAGQRRPSSFQ